MNSRGRSQRFRLRGGLLSLMALSGFSACSGEGSPGDAGAERRPLVAFVTNGIDPFWTIAQAGAEAAARDFDVTCDVRMPAAGIVDQKRIVEDLLVQGVDGIAISPIDAVGQTEMLNQVADQAYLITHDSDAPGSRRLCYIGMLNYEAGRMCGELVKEVLPDGGKVILFVGRLEQENARGRRQGIIDELLDRSDDPTRFDPPAGEIRGSRFTILDTRTDQFDYQRAKSNAEDSLSSHARIDAMIGLFAYNAPACLEALRTAGRVGEIPIVAFDERQETLEAILRGDIYATVVQQPYQYGYQSVRLLAALARGDRSVLPEGGFLDLPARQIRKDNAQEYWDELRPLLGDR